jgi:inorganic pyrophosphatase/exopolyphosphatase
MRDCIQETCDLNGIPAEVVFPGPVNESVPKNWAIDIKTSINGVPENYDYVVVDISDPTHFARFVIVEKVAAVYDHRWGHEVYWKEKLGKNARIEPLGTCATLIWEEFVNAGLGHGVDPLSANLLYTAILSNTLNLNARITKERDRKALVELKPYTDLPVAWGRLKSFG